MALNNLRKSEASGLPYQDGVRVPIQVVVAGLTYEGGLRTTRNMPTVWISPDLRDREGTRISLARALNDAGFHKNQALTLNITGIRIELAALRGAPDIYRSARADSAGRPCSPAAHAS